MIGVIYLLIFCYLIFALIFIPMVCYDIAQSKGHSGFTWMLYGGMFGIIALIAVLGIQDRTMVKIQKQQSEILDEIRLNLQSLHIKSQV